MAVSKELLSGSTDGRNIKVAATSTPGTTIHTAHATSLDEVYLYACNTSASSVKLTLELGGTTSPDDLLEVSIPAESGDVLIKAGTPYTGSVVIRAFADSANVINVSGFVNRIS